MNDLRVIFLLFKCFNILNITHVVVFFKFLFQLESRDLTNTIENSTNMHTRFVIYLIIIVNLQRRITPEKDMIMNGVTFPAPGSGYRKPLIRKKILD